MFGMIECKVCQKLIELDKKDRYTARDNESIGFSNFTGTESSLYDAFDCPYCGCQNIVNDRKRYFEPFTNISDIKGEDDE